MDKHVYRKMAGVAVAILSSGCITMSVLADDPTAAVYDGGPTTNLWLSVVEVESEARLSVTVPTSYGFAVVGTVDPDDRNPVSSANGTVLLSNVRVEVTSPGTAGGNQGEYTITTVGEPQVLLKNYSTDVRDENLSDDDPLREGLPVEIKPYVAEEPETLIDNLARLHYWKPIESDPTGKSELFKRYRMGLDDKYFSEPKDIYDGKGTHRVYFLAGELSLPAPPDVSVNGWNAAGLANIPSVTAFKVDVQVGGTRNQYHQVEQSVMVGEIGWEIIPGELPPLP